MSAAIVAPPDLILRPDEVRFWQAAYVARVAREGATCRDAVFAADHGVKSLRERLGAPGPRPDGSRL